MFPDDYAKFTLVSSGRPRDTRLYDEHGKELLIKEVVWHCPERGIPYATVILLNVSLGEAPKAEDENESPAANEPHRGAEQLGAF